jgi:hypothetical protein
VSAPDKPSPSTAPIESISEQVLPEIPDVPDSETQVEFLDFEEQHNKLLLHDHRQNIGLRKEFAGKIYWLVIAWVASILVLLVLEGFKIDGFSLSNSVLLALIGSSTLNIVGLLYVVTHYLFPKNS